LIGEVVGTVAGARRNGPELIEFMMKISDTRGYSAILRQSGEIGEWMSDLSLEEEAFDAITRGCAKSVQMTKCRDAVASEVRPLVESEAFPVRGALTALLRLVAGIADPRMVRLEAVRRGMSKGQATCQVLAAQVDREKHDNHAALREAVREAAGFKFSADAVVAGAMALIAVDFDEAGMKPSMASALETVCEPLRVCLERVKWKVDVARGFEALDTACAGAGWGPALSVFAVRWRTFRGVEQPPEVDPLAAAMVARDLPRRKKLHGVRDVREIKIDRANLPLDIPRPPWRKAANLLEIGAAVGGEVFRSLVEMLEWRPDPFYDCALEQAIAGGDPEALEMIWEGRDVKLARCGTARWYGRSTSTGGTLRAG
jgi:hypothetical protein